MLLPRSPIHDLPRPGDRHRLAHRVLGCAVLVGVCLLGSIAVPSGPSATASTTVTASTPVKKVATYWLVASDGGLFAFGGAGFYGSTGSIRLNKPMVGMAGTHDSAGYWLVASDGGIFAFGDAGFHGSTGNLVLNKPVVGMASTPDGGGYWLVAKDGGIFAFGDAGFYGSMGNQPLNKPVVGMASTPDGKGYWLVAADGGVFSFGDAGFHGSTGNLTLNKPIVGMTALPNGNGYWFTASDGGVFAFGQAPFFGSLGGVPQPHPIVAMASSADGKGYWFTNSNGSVTGYGDSDYWGSAPQVINKPVVGMAEAEANGHFTGSSYPSGSYGYDISNFQCGGLPPSPHTIGIVEVEGSSMGAANPCLADEAAWAAGGLNLYIYLTYGTAPSSNDPACSSTESPASCNFGFDTALDAFHKATQSGANTLVPWWLDVESDPSWSSDVAANAAMVQGAIDGLHFEGLNSVGIYSQLSHWSGIVGSYSPSAPEWVANWGSNVPPFNPSQYCSGFNFSNGTVQLVQYTDGANTNGFDSDYAC